MMKRVEQLVVIVKVRIRAKNTCAALKTSEWLNIPPREPTGFHRPKRRLASMRNNNLSDNRSNELDSFPRSFLWLIYVQKGIID